MGILNSTDKESIKVALPKKTNKIIDVAVARLYIAYPDPNKWQYTGLSGAIALVDDLVGNTFFLKLVDIEGHRGVIWDQELYVNFDYQQIRTFFHTFELEECYAGLLFEDLGEAAHFLKRIYKRERYGSKKTLSNKNAIALTDRARQEEDDEVHGPRGETLYGSQRERYNYSSDSDSRSAFFKRAPPPIPSVSAPSSQDDFSQSTDYWQSESSSPAVPSAPTHPLPPPVSIPSRPTSGPPSAVSPSIPSQATQQPSAHPFPFPIPEATSPGQITPFPKPQQPAQSYPAFQNFGGNRPLPPVPGRNNRPVPPPPPRGNRMPPPVPPSRRGPAPPPPPHRATPSNGPGMHSSRPAPPPPRRGPAPPPPPRSSRLTSFSQQRQQMPYQSAYSPPPVGFPQQTQPVAQPPPLAPRPPSVPTTSFNSAPPSFATPSPPPLAPRPQPPIPPTSFNNPPAPFGGGAAPPPPPPPPPPAAIPSGGGAPPPPPPPSMPMMSAPSAGGGGESTGDAGRDALLASIRGAGGIGSLKKVDKSQLDKPSVLLQEARGEPVQSTPASPSAGGAPGGGGSLADALAAALNKRKNKVGSNDDYDNGDDW